MSCSGMHINHLLVLGQLHLGPVVDGLICWCSAQRSSAIAIVLTRDSDLSFAVAFGFGDLLTICQVCFHMLSCTSSNKSIKHCHLTFMAANRSLESLLWVQQSWHMEV